MQLQKPGFLPTLLRLTAALSLATLSGLAAAQAVPIASTPTTLVSTADRMISYRMQNHMWQTPDGATHVMINRGPGMGGNSLALFSTFDGGTNWVNSGVSLPQSNGSSTSDGYFADGRLYTTYDVGTGTIRFAELVYDSPSKTWSLGPTSTVYTSAVAGALTPAVAVDAAGRQWLAFTHQDKATGNFSIKMMRKAVADQAWTDTGFVFGPVDNLANERSGRPIATARGMGLVFTVKTETYWAERNDRWALEQPWPRALISTKVTPTNDPYGTHFSIVADSAFNMHMFSGDGGQVVYSRYLVFEKKWSTRTLTEAIKATYMQATMSGNQLMLVTNSYANLSVYQSADGGNTFTRTHALTHPAATEGIDYSRPRVETPAYSTSPVPVLQQFMDGKLQRAMFFAVPVGSSVPVAADTSR
ncbi:MAG: hypothetical protein WAQ05_01760 [Rubrivivax sp.]